MPQRAQGLTAAQVEKGTTRGRFGDGGGLYLLVRSREAKFWLFRYTRHGKMREMGLGPAAGRTAIKLAQARMKARELHSIVREGRDPLAEREAEKAKKDADQTRARAEAMTFGEVADMVLAAHERSWRNPKHRQQWRNTLRDSSQGAARSGREPRPRLLIRRTGETVVKDNRNPMTIAAMLARGR